MRVFREVRRVLRKDGTLWLNYGEPMPLASTVEARPIPRPPATMTGHSATSHSRLWADLALAKAATRATRSLPEYRWRTHNSGPMAATILKPKDLCGVPWRVAFALQADGWWLRQDIIWSKPNPMPESIKDRCTKSHEYLFLLAKVKDIISIAEAISETAVDRRLAAQ